MKKKEAFFGRKSELAQLQSYLEKETSSLLVVRGRRRVGKSRLIREYAKQFPVVYRFAGVAPDLTTTAATQRENFAMQMRREMQLPPVDASDWSHLFWFMANQVDDRLTLIVLDEITWMGDKDSSFLSKLQFIWESQLQSKARCVVIICGSVSAWIEANILNNTGFVGRISLDLQVKPLPLQDCLKFWLTKARHTSVYEMLKVLSVTGGIPWYLEHIKPRESAEANIHTLAFTEGEILYRDFERIFTDVFGRRNDLYTNIVRKLLTTSQSQDELLLALKMEKTGRISEYLRNLIESGFVERDYTWSLKTGKVSKLSRYRLSDNYVRFYLKYIEPNKANIQHGNFKNRSIASMPGWDSIMGLQFENLVLNNRHLIQQTLKIHLEDIVFDNPYFQTKTQRQQSCQIDYLIQTKMNTVYVIELKYLRQPVRANVITEMMQKVERLALPKTMTMRPVLVHVNGVERAVIDSDYFVKVIDFCELLSS